MAKSILGRMCACKYCGQDIQFLAGNKRDWRDRGNSRACLPFVDKKEGEVIRPKTKHAPYKGANRA